MSTIEILFFSAAFLIPLVGGGTLLYVLSRDAKSKGDAGETSETSETKKNDHEKE
jgi:hypothetical protein